MTAPWDSGGGWLSSSARGLQVAKLDAGYAAAVAENPSYPYESAEERAVLRTRRRTRDARVSVAPQRGQVYCCDRGYGPTPWLVVSNNFRNRLLSDVIAIRLTTTARELATWVTLGEAIR